MRKTSKQKGFTLLELVVAVGIFMVIVAIAVSFLLKKVDEARVANIYENVVNIKSAVNSYVSKYGMLKDEDGDGDYLQELVKKGMLSPNVNNPACSVWSVRKVVDSNNKEAFVLEVDVSSCDTKIVKYFKILDTKVDDGSENSGNIRSINL